MKLFAGPGAYTFGDEEKRELLDVMESGYLSRYGLEDDPRFKRKVCTFEKEFAEHMGVKYAVATSSGTASLLICLMSLGVGPGDEVIVPGYTFVASISAILYARAIPVLAEIDESLNIDPEDIKKKITKRTKAIMPVHMLGNPCDMDKIMAIAKEHNLIVIEDACQACGASYKGKKLGSIGKMGAYSLNVFKPITTGDGGAVVTTEDELYERAFGIHDQGHKPLRMGLEVGKRSIVGFDFRMNELTGAVALAQVRKLDKILYTLREKKNRIKNELKGIEGLGFRKINDENGECGTLLTLLFEKKKIADKFCEKIGTQVLYNSGWHVYNNWEQILSKRMPSDYNCPFICEKYNKDNKLEAHMLPRTDDILSRAVNISIGVVDKGIGASYGITILSSDDEIKNLTDKIKSILRDI